MKWLRVIAPIALGISGVAIAISYTGIFQALELSVFDWWFRLRPAEAREERIVVVTIGEADLKKLKQWPISDDILSQLIINIQQQQPRAIGLDLYRDLPVRPGREKLSSVLRSTPNLIGVKKAIGEIIEPAPILKELERVALADLVLDDDRKVRRGLLSIQLDNGEVQLGLATRLALIYLAAENIELQPVGDTDERSLGKAVFVPFNKNDGGYINADAGGFQVLLNYRGTETSFDRVSIVEVLKGDIPKDLMRDRIVIIGSTAQSLNDLFATPYSSGRNVTQYLPGVFIHANIASQILSAALDGRKLIRVVSEPVEWLWVLTWTGMWSGISLWLLNRCSFAKHHLSFAESVTIFAILPGAFLLGSGYLLFLGGWWLPTIAPLFSSIGATIAVNNYHQQKQKKLAFIDGLTQIPNRRLFDRFLEQHWLECQRKHQSLSLILCDVDHFKKYNDTYGHQAGDLCLQKVADAIGKSIRSQDLAARYGGEEFAVVLPDTTPEVAMLVAKDIGDRLKDLQLPHSSSPTSKYVSLSCGIACTSKSMVTSPEDLIECADRALYQAKQQGRDRAVLDDKSR